MCLKDKGELGFFQKSFVPFLVLFAYLKLLGVAAIMTFLTVKQTNNVRYGAIRR
jgi:hypothetical protein